MLSETFPTRFWKKVRKQADCWLWTGATHPAGYGVIGRGARGAGNIRATHASWLLHKGPVPAGKWLLHKCDNPRCVNPDHLFLGTHLDNMRDCVAKGRYPKRRTAPGIHNPNGKLTAQAVAEIKEQMNACPPKRRGRD